MKVRGDWCYLYRAVDKYGKTLDFMLSEHRDETEALKFLAKAITANGLPRACAIDKSGANTAGPLSMNAALKDIGSPRRIWVYRSKYLNNIVEQINLYDHICKIWTSEPERFIVNPILQMPGLNS